MIGLDRGPVRPHARKASNSQTAEVQAPEPRTRGRPLTNRVAVVELIGATTTKAGLKVECALDTRTYDKGIKVSGADMASLTVTGDAFRNGTI